MTSLVVVGMQWGDEGKGKIVDLLCPAFDAVARYQGGHNAGHTVKFGDRHFSLHLIPSGILHPDTVCFLGNGLVIDPDAFARELAGLRAAGVDPDGRLFVSDRAQVLLPALARLDQAREGAAGDQKIGTTSRGIGPAYELKAARIGLRVADLLAGDSSGGAHQRLDAQLHRVGIELADLDADAEDWREQTRAALERGRETLGPFVADVSLALDALRRRGDAVLFEGAQGTLLDVDHGTYPYVTSSSSTAGGACTGCGVPPAAIGGAIGILKAYTTRVGEGPFPTELPDAKESAPGSRLRTRGNEYGTTTGRPRRCGWLDLVVARYARRVNGIGAIALTKLDVLDSFDEIQLCDAYRIDGELVRELPADLGSLARAEPVYESFPGWRTSTEAALEHADLPAPARAYVETIEERVGAPIELISTGPRREETIVRDRVLGPWLGTRLERVLAERGAPA
ncbi:MAG TPA: adenylosuccinate synthase [Thermoanaerobaculia bacterium]|nr:adenylosuccinate synthase [Thermoanaerobaculia bacterium]